MTVTKADLVDAVYRAHTMLTRKESEEAVEALLKRSKEALIGGSDLLISGFGKFHVKDKRARKGRNPQTGESMTLDARRVVTFSPSGLLRKKINTF